MSVSEAEIKAETSLISETEKKFNRRQRWYVSKEFEIVCLSVKIGYRCSQLNFVISTNRISGKTERRGRSRKLNLLQQMPVGLA